MTKNITLAVDEAVLDKVRRIALDRKPTVNGLVREYLTRLADLNGQAANARKEIVRLSKESTWNPGDDWTWNREDIYDRPMLRGHERPGLRNVDTANRSRKKKAGR